MDSETIATELAEEIRRNTALRHRLGMDEGSDSGKVDDEDAVGITTTEGENFFIAVERS